jgi:flagellar motor switch protein FliM
MEKVLNQEEIDAMVRAARARGAQTSQADELRVEVWDARRAGQIGKEQLQAITLLHEAFARNLTHSLGAYLRVVFAAALVSAEHLTYREFLQRIPETTYLASCNLEPMGVQGALQLDMKVAFPIIDLLLGGVGKGLAATREITEIEEQIVESVARIVCRELGTAWQALALQVGFDRRMEPAEARRLMPPEEKTLSLSFEVTMPEVRGGLNFAVPVSVSNALLRKISTGWAGRRPRSPAEWRERLKRRLLECSFPIELGINDARASLGALDDLRPGSLLSLHSSTAEPAALLVAGLEMFRALPARRGSTRAAQIVGPGRELQGPGEITETKQS